MGLRARSDRTRFPPPSTPLPPSTPIITNAAIRTASSQMKIARTTDTFFAHMSVLPASARFPTNCEVVSDDEIKKASDRSATINYCKLQYASIALTQPKAISNPRAEDPETQTPAILHTSQKVRIKRLSTRNGRVFDEAFEDAGDSTSPDT
jgi:hypothetical protein